MSPTLLAAVCALSVLSSDGARAVAAAGHGGATAQSAPLPEYQAKARYIGVLAEFVTWPGGPEAEHSLVLGVIGRSPFEANLEEEFARRHVKGRQVRVEYFRNVNGIRNCQILFICESESDRIAEILAALRGSPVLTVGDSQGFAQRGVMVNILLEQRRVNLDINLTTLRQTGLEISSHVLKLAKNVF